MTACRHAKDGQMKTRKLLAAAVGAVALLISFGAQAQFQMERLSRGVIAVRTSSSQVYVGWRLFGTDPSGTAFNLYRSTNGGAVTLLNGAPLTSSTNFVDNSAPPTQSNSYFVRPVLNGIEQAASAAFMLPANAPTQQFLQIPLQIPPGGTTPSGEAYTYTANDLSVGDLDGDGEFEYVLKWDPTNSKDNSQAGLTGNVFLDAYKLNGTRLWRIDLGRNIRAGAHYTQFMVYDFDGDGKAEVMCKTGDGTRSGTGQVIGDANADWRDLTPNPASGRIGYVLHGPEFLSVFNGQTGAVMATTNYVPARGAVTDWGDNYGNRVDRFLAGVAYLDGQRPSAIFTRGYYTRTVIAAWDWRNGALTQRWVFDSNVSGSQWRGQGNHQLSVADIDGDGKQEIIFGSLTIDDNGAPLYASGLGHGDALHVGDFVPSRPGLEIWDIHEADNVASADLRDARTGARLFSIANTSGLEGPGRGVADDIWAGHAGAEFWGAGPGMTNLFSETGAVLGRTPSSANFLVWWDADTTRELLDGNHIDKYGPASDTRLLTASGVSSNNSTKSTPALSGDLFGDWREEVVWRTSDNTALRIYTTTIPATNRFYTFLHDPQYRVALAWQNTAYNQPPHPGFFVGSNMAPPPTPNIVLVGTDPNPPGRLIYQLENAVLGGGTVAETTNGGFLGSGYANLPLTGGFAEIRNADGRGGGNHAIRIRYALGVTASRTGRLLVNGVAQNITFNGTGAWSTWATHDVTVSLNTGTVNTIRLESNGQDLANIDQVEIL
jgi:rhamnogalacturonan endolyase